MPKLNLADDLEHLVSLIAARPDGADVDQLLTHGGASSRRTLQRHLALLAKRGRILQESTRRPIMYRLAPIAATVDATLHLPAAAASAELYVPTSPAGEKIKAYVRQPLQGRKPVGYSAAFLEAYQPNHTWYLPEKLRKQLHSMGHSPAGNAPAGTFARDILSQLLIINQKV